MNTEKVTRKISKAEAQQAIEEWLHRFLIAQTTLQMMLDERWVGTFEQKDKDDAHDAYMKAATGLIAAQSDLLKILTAPREAKVVTPEDVRAAMVEIQKETGKKPSQRAIASRLGVAQSWVNTLMKETAQ